MALGPEEVEEESRSKDEGDCNASENVEGSGAHDIVVVHVDVITWAQLLDERLLLYVIYASMSVNSNYCVVSSEDRVIPAMAAVPTDSEQTQQIMAS